MRPKSSLVKITLVLMLVTAIFQPGLCLAGNLLGDNGFESSEPNGGFPDSGFWKGDWLWFEGAACTATSARLDNQGLRQATGLSSDFWQTIVYQDIPTWPDKVYFASAWVTTTFPGSSWLSGSSVFLKVEFLDASKNVLAQYNSSDVNTPDAGWTLLYFATKPAPAHTRFVRFSLCLEKPQLVGQTIVNFDDCILRQIECSDCLRLDEIPPCRSDATLQGSVFGVNPDDYVVGVYLFVDDWWPKPTFDNPWTEINPDGSWQCDISTSIYDLNAAEVMAFLVPKNEIADWPVNFNTIAGLPAIPAEAFRFPSVGSFRQNCFDTIEFAGYNWLIKDSADRPVGPGPNLFDSNNVWVDEQGLHLKITNDAGLWRCAEVFTEDSLGDGVYKFILDPNSTTLDPNVVLGLFTWDEFAPHYSNREMDIEISRWGNPAIDNAQYVIQPDQIHRFNIEPRDVPVTHILDWSFDLAAFQSFFGQAVPFADDDFIDAWSYLGNAVPRPGSENIRLNLWLLPGLTPGDVNKAEVVIKDFEFIPCSYDTQTTALDFNSVLITRTAAKAVKISNGHGCSPYLVTVEVTGPDANNFLVADAAFELQPGANKEIDVTFIPDSNRVFNASLVITGDVKTEIIPLTGAGVRIGYTRIPTVASPELLYGLVEGVSRSNYRVVSYIRVFDKWYIKPLCFSNGSSNNPLKSISSAGAWSCNIDIEWTDKAATEVASFLIPKNADYPPCVLDSLDDPRMAGYDRASAQKPRLGISKITASAGASNDEDKITIDGRYYISANQVLDADQLCLRIGHQEQLIDSLCIPFDAGSFMEDGKFRYDRTGIHVRLQNSGTLLNSYAGVFHIELSKTDLTCLRSPVSLNIEVGSFNETALADEAVESRIINSKKLMPIQFLAGCSDSLRVDSVKVNAGANDSVSVKGAIVFEGASPDLTEQDLVIAWGNDAFTIPPGSFRRVGKSGISFRCSNKRIAGNALVNANFDFTKSSFQVKISKAKLDTDSEFLDFNIAVAGFSEGVSVKTGR